MQAVGTCRSIRVSGRVRQVSPLDPSDVLLCGAADVASEEVEELRQQQQAQPMPVSGHAKATQVRLPEQRQHLGDLAG